MCIYIINKTVIVCGGSSSPLILTRLLLVRLRREGKLRRESREPGTRAEGDGEEEAEELKKESADWEMSADEGYAKGQRVTTGTMLDEDAEVGDEPITNESKQGKEFFEATGVQIDWANPADVNQKFQLLRRAITKYLKEIDATIEYFYYI